VSPGHTFWRARSLNGGLEMSASVPIVPVRAGPERGGATRLRDHVRSLLSARICGVLVVVTVTTGGLFGVVTYGVKLQRSADLRLAVHEDACTVNTFATWCRARRERGERLAVDLFSGAGGLSLGLEQGGWTVALAVDNDSKALQTHRHNFPGLTLPVDLGDRTAQRDLVAMLSEVEIDLVAGGPPCQPFSRAGRSKIRSLVSAGKRDATDERRALWRAFLDVTLALQPRAALMENVPDMALGDDFRVVRTMVEELEDHGYHTDVRLVDTWHYRVPQHRKRLIVLARRDSPSFTWPDRSDMITTLEQAIGDLPKLGLGTGARCTDYTPPVEQSEFAAIMREGAPDGVVWDHMTRPVRDDDREVFTMMDSRTLYADIPRDRRRYTADTFDDKYKRLGWDELSRSITAHIAKDGYWYIHPDEHRTLTVREAARIQTFPDRFRFAGTRSDAFRQIGNAVPPLLGYAAALALHPEPINECPSASAPATIDVPPLWRRTREALTTWARAQRSGPFWFLLPGDAVTPAVAAATALLVGRATKARGAEEALAIVRGHVRFNGIDITAMQDHLSADPGRAALERFRYLTRRTAIWSNVDQMADELALTSSQRSLFRLLCGQDLMLENQSAFRVAARVAGTSSDRTNRLSDGRVDLARLVGAGPDATLRMAALRLLGNTVCRQPQRVCHSCPLRQHCASAELDRNDAVSRPLQDVAVTAVPRPSR